MRVLMVHNFYQLPGGEDESFRAEVAALESQGVDVDTYTLHNDAIREMGRAEVALKTVWNSGPYHDIRERVSVDRHDLVHFQNTFPLLSPAGYYAARAGGAAVVQSVRNFRFTCVNAQLFRDGAVCTDCVGHLAPVLGVMRGCYRGSRSASAVVATMLGVHKTIGTFSRKVDRYIAISEFVRGILVEAGYSPEMIAVKPNSLTSDPPVGGGEGGYLLYVGRLTREKGVGTLLEAWKLASVNAKLRVAGDGPMAADVRASASHGVDWLGNVTHDEVLELIAGAAAVVVPSEWYEPFGRVVVEAFACGTPVIAARSGALPELVEHGSTGMLFRTGDSEALGSLMKGFATGGVDLSNMREAARRAYETRFSTAVHAHRLLDIYRASLAAHGSFGA